MAELKPSNADLVATVRAAIPQFAGYQHDALNKLAARIAELETANTQLYAAFHPQNIANPREARQHVENLRQEGSWEALTSMAKELGDANARAAELEQQQAERGHMEEGARLLRAVSRTMSFMRAIEVTSTDLLSEDLVAWLDAERARKATSGGG